MRRLVLDPRSAPRHLLAAWLALAGSAGCGPGADDGEAARSGPDATGTDTGTSRDDADTGAAGETGTDSGGQRDTGDDSALHETDSGPPADTGASLDTGDPADTSSWLDTAPLPDTAGSADTAPPGDTGGPWDTGAVADSGLRDTAPPADTGAPLDSGSAGDTGEADDSGSRVETGDADTGRSGDSAPATDTGAPDDTADTGVSADTAASTDTGVAETADWCSVQAIFDASCTSCHSVSGGLEAGLDLQVDAWDNLVGQASALYAGETLVSAGDSSSSLLYAKVAGTQGSNGYQMPYGGPYLDADTVAAIAAWIDAGALETCEGESAVPPDTGGGDTADTGASDTAATDTATPADTAPTDSAADTASSDTGEAGPWDLDLTGAAWSSHVGDPLYLNVVRDRDAAVVATTTTVISSGTPTLSFSDVLEAGESYTLDYFADENANGTCESYPTDHVFHQSIGTPTGDMAVTITHSGALVDNAGCDSF